MATSLHDFVFYFFFFLALTLLFSWWGDDDVIYAYMDRKPTGAEGIARIRFVLAKGMACLYGGGVLAVLIVRQVQSVCSIVIPREDVTLFQGFCWIVVGVFISILQKFVRKLRRRPQRPIFDLKVFSYNRSDWKRWLGR